ncbi:hypothetical protein EYF80_037388 [Liparis tanakae]|uniref:Uncharacterized protein n=1 Tax=Liparis tanakae TaxID=230148 RepID=A0A4Z2GFW6_9TELE|nr:hypothetical protein EYF80_037388 [Liparis tanakae]
MRVMTQLEPWEKGEESLVTLKGRVSERLYPELCLQALVHHVADADGRHDLEEVGGEAPVEAPRALGPQDLPEEAGHRHLRGAGDRSWKDKHLY